MCYGGYGGGFRRARSFFTKEEHIAFTKANRHQIVTIYMLIRIL